VQRLPIVIGDSDAAVPGLRDAVALVSAMYIFDRRVENADMVAA
jgi:hypothetical protein